MKRTAVGAICALVALCTSALGVGYYSWQWEKEQPTDSVYDEDNVSDLWLTRNNGSHAVALGGGRTCAVAEVRLGDAIDSVCAFEWPVYSPLSFKIWQGGGYQHPNPSQPCVAANESYKFWMCSEVTETEPRVFENQCVGASSPIGTAGAGNGVNFTTASTQNNDHTFAGACFPGATSWLFAAFENWDDAEESYFLTSRRSYTGGRAWQSPEQIEQYHNTQPSLAAGCGDGSYVYVAYTRPNGNIMFEKSTDYGEHWGGQVTLSSGEESWPCIAAVGKRVFACWNSSGEIVYKFSTDAGDNWIGPDTIGTSVGTFSHTSVSMVTYGNPADTAVLLASQWSNGEKGLVFYRLGILLPNRVIWQAAAVISRVLTEANRDSLRPSVATEGSCGRLVYNAPIGGHKRGFHLRRGAVAYDEGPWPQDAAAAMSSGRRIARDPDGSMQYAAAIRPHVVSGPVDDDPIPIMVAPGGLPALALDGDGNRWVSYVNDDTVWTMTGDGSYKVTFAGSSSAVPGQPSIVCYPIQVNGAYSAAVTFCVYDTAGGSSMVMYARVDTGGVVLDTIVSAQNLGDSLPCISVYRSDTLVVTFSRGDSVMGTMLCDYGPGTSGQPPAWTSPNLVTANGYHAMSRFDDNGTVLNVTWVRNNGSNYAVQRATCDLATTAFGNWSTMATPGDTGTAEKANPVYAGLGVSCWQEKDNGKWVIKGFVRGEEETFVANDTDAYHPHAVAESSAISPSIDQVRVSILYTAGVTFEVDSGVYDTGETRYVCESLNVSHATSDATKYNTGAKLVRKNGSDSLFSVYSDLDNAVVFAWSATGDTWQRAVVVSGREYPAIAEDSSGRRWVVVTKPLGVGSSAIEAYYRSGSSWVGPQTLYTNAMVPLGPASLAGASYTQSGIAYAAFLNTSGMTKSVILAKFDGTNVSTCTVATGTTLGDPCITVEPYKADSDHVHVTWTDNGTLKYRMDTDGRSTSIASNWTSTYDLTGGGVTAQHPSINSDADQIVVAWAQGSPTDVYARKRSTDSAYNNWQTAVNLSNTSQDGSDYPTIAMGDTVVVAWQEARTGGGDFDILASIDFGDTLNIADNATFSTYPHIVFQNKASGDTAIPYLHTVWSETPEAEYYEVGYNKLNLKETEGEGQQAASLTPIPARPMLEACRPNPFKSHTQISYALPQAGNVSLRVYDITGRTVRTLASGRQKAGFYSVSWDARDSHGKQVPYGVYFYRLDTPGFRSVKKTVVAR